MLKTHNKVLWLTETAVMLALLITLQYFTKPLGQIVTGSCVNAVLAVTVLVAGYASGITVALLSPVFAYLLGIAPQILTVPAIMVGNTLFVLVLRLLAGDTVKPYWRQIMAVVTAAVGKAGVLYLLVAKVICGVLAQNLLDQGLLKAPMLKALPATFSWPQLVTALIGGSLPVLITPVLRQAVKK